MKNEYQLTGSLYQDYSNLIALYDKRNLKALTFQDDPNHHILLNLDIKDVNNFCKTNKDARNICNNGDFWRLKYEQDNIPMEDFPDNLQDWIENYKLWEDAYKNADLILYINEIEQTRSDLRTEGYIQFESIQDNRLLSKISAILNLKKEIPPLQPPMGFKARLGSSPNAKALWYKALVYALRFPDEIRVSDQYGDTFLPTKNDLLRGDIMTARRTGIIDSYKYNQNIKK